MDKRSSPVSEPGTADVDPVGEEMIENLVRTALFAALIGAFAYVSFPFPLSPAPVTLQVLGVFLAGILLGPVWGGTAMGLYLVAGALGAPVFAGGSAGIGVLLGESGGYLWSYPLAAALIGMLVHGGLDLVDPMDVSIGQLTVAMIGGVLVIYTLGVAQMMIVLDLAVDTAIIQGAAVFVPAEAAKMAAAIAIVRNDAIAAR